MSTRTSAQGPALEPRIASLSGETLVELLELATRRNPASAALVIRRGMLDERWTYQQVADRSERIARRLREAGLGAGDRVLTWSQNDPWLVAAYFAVWRLGAVIVPLDLRMQPEVAVRIGARTDPRLLLAGDGVDRAVAEGLGVPLISVDEHGLEPAEPTGKPLPLPPVRPTDVAEIVFTSGTTSDPKGVVLTHAQVVHTARMIAQTGMGPTPERALGIIPLSHMYGQTVPLLMGFMGGSTLVFVRSLTPKVMRSTMQRERITAVTLTPQVLGILMQAIESESRRRGSEASLRRGRRLARRLPLGARRRLFRSVLRPLGGELSVITSGAARLDPELQAAWEAFGVRVVQGYGTTECAAITGHSRDSRRPGTVGPPLAGLEVRIADDHELWVRGPSVMRGYWEAPEATADVLDEEGWLHTGDAATIDEAGEIVILGRTRDRIALPNGLNVYPEDVEAALVATDAIRAAVVIEPQPGRLAAALVPAETATDDDALDAAVKAANHTLAPHQRVGSWRRWPEDDFPRTHTLKIKRDPVRDRFAQLDSTAGTAPAATTATVPRGPAALRAVSVEEVAALVAGVIADASGGSPPDVSPSTEIAALELDSLTVVSLALRLDEAYESALSDDEILQLRDIDELHRLVLSRQGQPPPPAWSRWAFGGPARMVRRILDRSLAGWTIGMVAGPAVEGLEHLETVDGPVLVCPNHTSHLDAPLVRMALPPRLRDRTAIAAAADVWFDGSPLGPPSELIFGAIPFGRTTNVRASLERVGDLVNDGFSVIIFPEGTRSADGSALPMREGIGLLVRELRIPVVPAHIEGAHEILPKGASLPRHRGRAVATVRFGAPLVFGAETGAREITARVGQAIAQLARARPDG